MDGQYRKHTRGRPVGLALYGQSNRRSVGSPEALRLRSRLTRAASAVYELIQCRIARRHNRHAIQTPAMAERGGVL
eukprot:6123930-Pleurochrysis_carterae.AAC.1